MRHGCLNSWHGGETIKINRSFRGVLISLPSQALIYPAEHQPTLTCMSLLASPPLVTLVLLLEHSPSADFWSCSPICILHCGTLKKVLSVILYWNITLDAAECLAVVIQDLFPHGVAVISQSFHSGCGCRLRSFDRYIPLNASEGISPRGPADERRITPHCRGNLFQFDTKAAVGGVR